jgi:hypothetical protein
MGWVENKSIGFFLPAFTDELEGGESTESLESFGKIVSSDEVVEVSSQLVMTVVVIALDGGLLDRSVHAFYLPVGPGMIRLGQPMFDAVQQTDPVKGMSAKAGRWPCLFGAFEANFRLSAALSGLQPEFSAVFVRFSRSHASFGRSRMYALARKEHRFCFLSSKTTIKRLTTMK